MSYCPFLISPICLHHPSFSSHPTTVPLMVFHFFFPAAGLNENKLDERIDMNQQNLNNKTSNHKIEKTKTPTWTYLHTKKNQNPHKKHQTISIVTTNLNMKARKTKSILFGGFHWKKCKSSPLLRKWPCIATTFVGPIVGKTQAIKPHDLVPISNAPRFFAASTTHIFSFVASILLHYTSLPSSSLTSWINDGDGDGCWFCSYGAKAMRSKERSIKSEEEKHP